jgi:ATP-binding cassette, subfamily B, bacterial
LTEFIAQLPRNLETKLGRPVDDEYSRTISALGATSASDEFVTPSGGQLQRIALARVFMRIKEAELLILDEPSCNLDPEAELELFKNIKRLRNGKTTIFVTHRFNTVRIADRILVLEQGRVSEFGTHDELIKLPGGRYRYLDGLQKSGFYQMAS